MIIKHDNPMLLSNLSHLSLSRPGYSPWPGREKRGSGWTSLIENRQKVWMKKVKRVLVSTVTVQLSTS